MGKVRYILLVLTVSCGNVVAGDFYGGVQWGAFEFDSPYPVLNETHNTAGLLLGWMRSPWHGVEIRGGAGLGSQREEIEENGGVYEQEAWLDHYAAFYVRPQIEWGFFRYYVLLGYGEVKSHFEFDAGLTNGETLSGAFGGKHQGYSYGTGFSLVNSDAVAFGGEYLMLVDDGDYSFSGFNLSVQFRF